MAYKRAKGKSIVGASGTKKTYHYKGIHYKSTLERNMAMLLDRAGIDFKYEEVSYQVMKGFDFPISSFERQTNGKGEMIDRGNKKVLPIKYTPDFTGEGFIIETKGYANESFPIRWKMFKKFLVENGHCEKGTVVYKPQKLSECEEVIRLIKQQRTNAN